MPCINISIALIKTEKQKDGVVKFSYDVAKIILAITVISPIAKPETFHFSLFIGGFVVTALFFIFGYTLDAKEIKA
jgi:hypothetical protein